MDETNVDNGLDGFTEMLDLPPEDASNTEVAIEAVSGMADDPSAVDPVVDPVVDAPAGDTPVETEETPDQIIERMRGEILELSRGNTAPAKADPVAEGEQTETQTQQVWPIAAVDIAALITDEELDQMIDRPEVLRTALGRVLQMARQEAVQSMPEIIRNEVNRQVTMTKVVTDFYDTNRDLIPYSDYVSHIMRAEEQKNPTKTYREIFETVAQESRKRLGLKNVAPSREGRQNSSEGTPAFAGSRRGSNVRPTPTPTGGAGELADMMALKDTY